MPTSNPGPISQMPKSHDSNDENISKSEGRSSLDGPSSLQETCESAMSQWADSPSSSSTINALLTGDYMKPPTTDLERNLTDTSVLRDILRGVNYSF